MKPSAVQRTDCAAILDSLSSVQHLHPHSTLDDVLARVVASLECCPRAAEQAMRWLQLDPQTRIGRLRRSQLVQLSQSMYRFWRQNLERPAMTAPVR